MWNCLPSGGASGATNPEGTSTHAAASTAIEDPTGLLNWLARSTVKAALQVDAAAAEPVVRVSQYYLGEMTEDQICHVSDVHISPSLQSVPGSLAPIVLLGKGLVATAMTEQEVANNRSMRRVWPAHYLPKWLGVYTDRSIGRERSVCENLLAEYSQPSVLSLRMGRTTSPRTALTSRWALSVVSSVTKSEDTGVRIAGMRVYNRHSGEYVCKTLEDCAFTPFSDSLATFLGLCANWDDVLDNFFCQVSGLLHHFTVQSRFKFVGSSLLLIYDGADCPTGNPRVCTNLAQMCVNTHTHTHNVKVTMVDVGDSRVLDGEEQDEGYVAGLTVLKDAMDALKIDKISKDGMTMC